MKNTMKALNEIRSIIWDFITGWTDNVLPALFKLLKALLCQIGMVLVLVFVWPLDIAEGIVADIKSTEKEEKNNEKEEYGRV